MTLDFAETIFLWQLIVILILFLVKLYNVFRAGEWYDFRISIILFISWFIVYGIGFITFMQSAESASLSLFSSLFTIETALLIFNVAFFIFEIFYLIKRQSLATIQRPEEAYNSFEANRKR